MDLVKIGKYIAGKRKDLGFTQKQLAEKLGMSDKSVSKWERGICLPDVSVYMELCEILGISINEFLAGEDIPKENIVKKSEDNLIEVAKDSKHRIKNLKSVIAVLFVVTIVALSVLGTLAYRYINAPKDYIVALEPDSLEMKTAKLLSGPDGAFLFKYASASGYHRLKLYLSEYQSGELIRKSDFCTLEGGNTSNDANSSADGIVLFVPDFENFSVRCIVTCDGIKYSGEIPILEDAKDREYYGRSAEQIEDLVNIKYGSEQGLLALIYGKNGLEVTPISSLEKGQSSKRNDFVYYISFMFEK